MVESVSAASAKAIAVALADQVPDDGPGQPVLILERGSQYGSPVATVRAKHLAPTILAPGRKVVVVEIGGQFNRNFRAMICTQLARILAKRKLIVSVLQEDGCYAHHHA
jgi:hypothetical protein